jgi:hypothetical protein
MQSAAVVAADRIEERSRIRAAHIIHAHVRNIEQPRRLPRRQMLLKNGRVHHRHFPTRKRDHPAAEVSVDLIQRRLL